MKINWAAVFQQAISLIEPVVKTVEIVSEDNATGASKQQMAEDAIAGATGIAATFLTPADQQKASAISQIVSEAIPATVTQLNASGTMPVKILATIGNLAGDAIEAAAIATQPSAPTPAPAPVEVTQSPAPTAT